MNVATLGLGMKNQIRMLRWRGRGERDIAFVIGCPFAGVWVVERSEREGKAV